MALASMKPKKLLFCDKNLLKGFKGDGTGL